MTPCRYRIKGESKWKTYDGLASKSDNSPIVKIKPGEVLEYQVRNNVYVCQQVGKNEGDAWDPDNVAAKERDKVVATYSSNWSSKATYKNNTKHTLEFSGCGWVR